MVKITRAHGCRGNLAWKHCLGVGKAARFLSHSRRRTCPALFDNIPPSAGGNERHKLPLTLVTETVVDE